MAIQCLQSTHEKAQLEWVKNNSNLTKLKKIINKLQNQTPRQILQMRKTKTK